MLALVSGAFSALLAQGIDKPKYQIVTHRAGSYLGTFHIELFPLIAPLHVINFDSLANAQAFDSTAFHRVVPGFVIQGGDPNSINGPISTWGYGNPNQPTVPAEFSVARHLRGRLGAARDTNINSATSQFYICVANALFLDGQYTVYGQVTSGMDVVDTIVNSPRNSNDVPLQKIEMFITYTGVNDSIPDPPVLSLPASQAVNILANQGFSWTPVSSAVIYTIEFAADSAFTNILYTKKSGVNSVTFPEMLPGTGYFWRVRSNNGGHESIESNVFSFNTAGAANLITPADSSVNVFLNPLFTWNAVPGITTYTLQVATDISFTSTSIKVFQSGIVDTSFHVWGLDPNMQYYWRIRSYIGSVPAFYSQKFSFMTGTTIGILENTSEKNQVITSVYPNPARSKVTVEVNAMMSGTAVFEICNVEGKTVYLQKEELQHNTTAIDIDVSSFSEGTYFISVKIDGRTDVRKIEIH